MKIKNRFRINSKRFVEKSGGNIGLGAFYTLVGAGSAAIDNSSSSGRL